MNRDLTFEAEYPHPIEKVWRAITERDAIRQWLMENDFEPRVGHRFQFRAQPQPRWDGIVHGEVLEVDPPRRLSYAWRSSAIDTRLTITLEPTAHGTRLRLEHTGFRGAKALMVSFILGSGWKKIVADRIPSVLASMRDDGASQVEGQRVLHEK